jgi:hypothetical protein
MKTDAGRGRLYDAIQTLQNRWADVEPHWTDQVRQEFEEKIWEPLNFMTEDALRAIDRLAQVFAQARRECTGERGLGELLS